MMLPRPFNYHRPRTLDEAVSFMTCHADDVSPYAGGTELLLAMKMHFADYQNFVDLKRIPELRAIARHDDMVSLGALATHADIAVNAVIRDTLPALARLCASIANVRVRASGTIGGNLCFAEPRADPPILLAALDAQLYLKSARGERRVAASQFITGALETIRAMDEILLRIEIPLAAGGISYERVVHGHRTVAGAAVVLANDPSTSARVWVGCVAGCPASLPSAERYIAANPDVPDNALKQAIAADIGELDVIDDEDASADYRRHLALTVAHRAIAAALGRKVSV
ncbi:MAG: carbon monoxide dehydrogenase [Rhodospirillaceae bacterium]|jgi:carbon-monoxide dehydrogenase medium subunit|nr:carbon monoxide dehydrogenase [Rhodospirillaceae bacterium]MBT3779475.1 carbon monoxide dehydrogenase [Rhodospirillaceae bacterium]MBT4171336.1 carbon monoxide dehydrogenase [Rhodospirillaceae bacterium]MBT4563725.1 carbon monoxide dehydrogenase [Rhodospirillaceae bacterium]MBT5127644.1 carbon monoxide dehydrogenase [Rhodospirillaceae bacterium]